MRIYKQLFENNFTEVIIVDCFKRLFDAKKNEIFQCILI